jgi:antitoxin (DNA-binding transcriptional repressor) of toxin-antitoxin stability system
MNTKGKTVRITRRRVPVAKLVPTNNEDVNGPRGIAADIRRLRKGVTLGKTTIRQLIDEGRRY